jgi:hypothetical protein
MTNGVGFEGKFFVRCKKHRIPYSVFYGGAQTFDREAAERRALEFRDAHVSYWPDCAFDCVVEDAPRDSIINNQ